MRVRLSPITLKAGMLGSRRSKQKGWRRVNAWVIRLCALGNLKPNSVTLTKSEVKGGEKL